MIKIITIVFSSLLDRFYNAEILIDEEYTFSLLPQYYIPSYSNNNSYIEYISSLPISTEPEALGLNENAKITRDYQESQNLFQTILSTLPIEVIK